MSRNRLIRRSLVTLFSLTSAGALTLACSGDDAEASGGQQTGSGATAPRPGVPGDPRLPAELTGAAATPGVADAGAEVAENAADAASDAPYDGPYFAVTKIAAGVYREPRFDKKNKLGYIRNGGRAPTDGKPVSTSNCSGGWYAVAGGGYVCGNLGTTNLGHPEVKHSIKAPDLSEVLPYKYARNAKNGTPLYRSVPSREQMLRYEPYLDKKKKAEEKKKAEAEKKAKAKAKAEAEKKKKADAELKTASKKKTSDDGKKHVGETGKKHVGETGKKKKKKGQLDVAEPMATATKGGETKPASSATAPTGDISKVSKALADAGAMPVDVDAAAPEIPWWQQSKDKQKLNDITLEQLSSDSDEILAKRMVSGFYVAIDKTFRWNGRLWYKTTKGLVAPSDRFWQTAGSKFQGVELGAEKTLPLAWVYGGRKRAPTYEINLDDKKVKPKGQVKRFEAIELTGREVTIRKKLYSEIKGGTWVPNRYVRITRPAAPPDDVGPKERWLDVNSSEQTLVVFEGTRAVYATLVSTGKTSRTKSKDHSTPIGEFRVREKHITTTMDGNGSAAGDLPYSIEDVPFVMYYKGSYAVHGAFWHRNYGAKMSHGCVNLAPLDAKWVFLYSSPFLPAGWHGVWASDDNPGSRVRVHG